MVSIAGRMAGALSIVAAAAGAAAADPITFHTPLPFERRTATIFAQGAIMRAPDGPAPENANETVATAQLTPMFHLGERVAIGATMSYVDRRSTVMTPDGGEVERRTSGIGDVSVMAAARPLRTTIATGLFGVAAFAAVKLPTGSDDEIDSYGRLPQRLQVGTGAWDASAGATVSWCRSPVEADLSLGYTYRTENHDFEAGDELTGQLSARRCVAPWSGCTISTPRRLYIVGETRATWYARDQGRLAPAESGGTAWYLSPGLQSVLGRHAVEAIVEVPVAQPIDQHIAAVFLLGYRMIIE